MGDAYGWTNNGRQVFDPVRLEKAAAKLREQNSAQQLQSLLLDSLAPPAAFGSLSAGPAAADRLHKMYTSMQDQLEKVGIDISDLASRALAAAQLAHEVDPATQSAAHRAIPD